MGSSLRRRGQVLVAGVTAAAALLGWLGLASPLAAAEATSTKALASSVRALTATVEEIADDYAARTDPSSLAAHGDELRRAMDAVRSQGGTVSADIAAGGLTPQRAASSLAAPHLELLRALGGLSAAAPALPGLPSLPPLPPIPEPLQPAVGVVVPLFDETVGRVCGLAKLGLSLGGGLAPTIVAQILSQPAAADALKPLVQPVIGVVTQVLNLACNSLPVRQFRTTCDADGQIAGLLPTTWPQSLGFLGGVIGPPTSLVPAPVGALVDTAAAAERAAGADPAASDALASQLTCATVDRFDAGSFDLTDPDLGGEDEAGELVAIAPPAIPPPPSGDLAAAPFSVGELKSSVGVTAPEPAPQGAGEVALPNPQRVVAVPDDDRPWLRLVLLCAGLLAGAAALLGPGARSLLGHVR